MAAATARPEIAPPLVDPISDINAEELQEFGSKFETAIRTGA